VTISKMHGSISVSSLTLKRQIKMSKYKFKISMTNLEKVYDMPDTWSDDDYLKLLSQLEVEGTEDIAGDDLLDLMLMALQDLELDEAADTILAYRINGHISS